MAAAYHQPSHFQQPRGFRPAFAAAAGPAHTELFAFDPSLTGFIIGRGGSSINALRDEFGVVLTIDKEVAGQLSVQGPAPSVARCIERLQRQIERFNSDPADNVTETISYPAANMGMVIGRGGSRVKELQSKYGVRIVVDSNAESISASGNRRYVSECLAEIAAIQSRY